MTGLPSPKTKVPHAVAMAFAFFDETVTGKLRGKEPRATVEAVRMGRKMMFASSAKAERELGLAREPVDNALRRQWSGSWRTAMRRGHRRSLDLDSPI